MNGENTSMVWQTFGSRMAKNRTDQNICINNSSKCCQQNYVKSEQVFFYTKEPNLSVSDVYSIFALIQYIHWLQLLSFLHLNNFSVTLLLCSRVNSNIADNVSFYRHLGCKRSYQLLFAQQYRFPDN